MHTDAFPTPNEAMLVRFNFQPLSGFEQSHLSGHHAHDCHCALSVQGRKHWPLAAEETAQVKTCSRSASGVPDSLQSQQECGASDPNAFSERDSSNIECQVLGGEAGVGFLQFVASEQSSEDRL